MTVKILSVLLSVIMFLFIIELIRREKLSFKYAVGWLFMSLLGVVLAVFDGFVNRIAYFLGFELPSNFIFFACLLCLVFLSLLLTIFLCQLNRRNDAIVQKLALLQEELERIKSSCLK